MIVIQFYSIFLSCRVAKSKAAMVHSKRILIWVLGNQDSGAEHLCPSAMT